MVVLNVTSPMAKCRVLYIGSAVPLDTAAGLDAIQGPLKERYPVDDESSIEGIDAMVSVTDSCIQMQYMNDVDQIIQFPISTLTLCAAVRCVSTVNTATGEKGMQFVSLNDPLAGGDSPTRPAIFTAITRRTQGRKVLECHGFICTAPKDALNLVKSASIAGKNYKQNGTIKSYKQSINRTLTTNGTSDAHLDMGDRSNRLSNGSAFEPTSSINRSSVQNGTHNGASMRLVPAEPISQITAGPEFFEPVSTQGYFYSSNNTAVKKYNIEKLNRDTDKETVNATSTTPRYIPTHTQVNNAPVTTHRPTPNNATHMPAPIYVRHPRQHYIGPPMPRPTMPMFFRPPPPMYGRPRFFSPPPPRMRPHPFMMPPGAPPPMMAEPIFIRRPRDNSAGSKSRSQSSDSALSRDSRSKTPTRQANDEDNTIPKRIPNADESSEDSIRATTRQRPSTPPTDYDDRRKGERMSRRDTYEVKYGIQPPQYGYGPPPDRVQQHGYDYYVHPPRHGGYAPFTMYNPHLRSTSVPGIGRQRSKSPRRKKGKKKTKKQKRNMHMTQPQDHSMYYPREGLRRQPEYSDNSPESIAGYNSELPRGNRPNNPTTGYQLYPPRDFRQDENQHMNERNFSKSIKEQGRQSYDPQSYQTAYELNDAMNIGAADKNDGDFTMY